VSDIREPEPDGKMVIFSGAGAPSLEETGMVVERSIVGGASLEELFSEASVGSSSSAVPFRQEGADGFSLVSIDFPPGFLLPRHSHCADCLYYIVSGGVVMGTRELGPGDGFFVPADQPYGYRVGPDGVKLLEFRHRTVFDTKFYEKDPARFREKAEASLAEAGGASSETRTID